MRPKGGLSRRSTFLLVTLIVAAGAIAATAYTLWRLRADAVDHLSDSANSYARSFEDHLTQSFNVIDLTLANIADDDKVSIALTTALRHAPYLRSAALLDAQGVISASSEPRNVGIRIARGDFLPPTHEQRAILRAGPLWAGRDFHDGRPITPQQPASPDTQTMITLLRDVAAGADQWITLLASVNTDYFLNYYGRTLAPDAGVVELFRYDGALLLSSDPKRPPGTRSSDAAFSSLLTTREFGSFEQVRDDGSAVLTAYRASRIYPFVVVVHLDKERGLAGWRHEAERSLAVVLTVLLSALALATIYFLRLERAAREHDAALEQLRLRGAALEAAANSIIITDRCGNIEWVNRAFCEMSGYTPTEALGRNPRDLIRSGMQAKGGYANLWQTILAGNVWRGELINRRKDKSNYPEDQTITPVRDADGAITHFIAIKQDITQRKEYDRRMEELSRHLIVVQESARRRLAGDLHERTSPNLAAIGINLDIISEVMRQEQSPTVRERLEDVRALIEDTTASIREICSDLRPPILDYAGLVAAVDSYVKQFCRRTSIAVRVDCVNPDARLEPELESVLFRIIQEALTNCAKHSRAASIVVELNLDGQPVTVAVSDDGIGFDPKGLGRATHTSGLGMLTMREMAEFSGGRFTLEAAPGKGTLIRVEIDPRKETA